MDAGGGPDQQTRVGEESVHSTDRMYHEYIFVSIDNANNFSHIYVCIQFKCISVSFYLNKNIFVDFLNF